MSHDLDDLNAHIWEKPLKLFFSTNRNPVNLKHSMGQQSLKHYKAYMNDEWVLRWTYFTRRSNLVA